MQQQWIQVLVVVEPQVRDKSDSLLHTSDLLLHAASSHLSLLLRVHRAMGQSTTSPRGSPRRSPRQSSEEVESAA